ncbi:MAG: hypothetical protein ABI576_14975 [Flavobacterium sp.]
MKTTAPAQMEVASFCGLVLLRDHKRYNGQQETAPNSKTLLNKKATLKREQLFHN